MFDQLLTSGQVVTITTMPEGQSMHVLHGIGGIKIEESDGQGGWVKIHENKIARGVTIAVTNATWRVTNYGAVSISVSMEVAESAGTIDNDAVNDAIEENQAATREALGIPTPLNFIEGCPYNTLRFLSAYAMFQCPTDSGLLLFDTAANSYMDVVFVEDTAETYNGEFYGNDENSVGSVLTIYYPSGATWEDFRAATGYGLGQSSWVSTFLKSVVVGFGDVTGVITNVSFSRASVNHIYPGYVKPGGNQIGDFAPLNGAVWNGIQWVFPVRHQPNLGGSVWGIQEYTHIATPNEVVTLVLNPYGTFQFEGVYPGRAIVTEFPYGIMESLSGYTTHETLSGALSGVYLSIPENTASEARVGIHFLPSDYYADMRMTVITFDAGINSVEVSLNN